jgi:very-short-patch-repair endonuclease
MDFLLLLPGRRRVVIEIDGKQHYAAGEKASPRLYAEMVAEDRRLQLAGYEVFRFGGYELMSQEEGAAILRAFFVELLTAAGVLGPM